MRVLQVAPRYAPAWAYGGGVRMSFELGKELVERGHRVTAFASDQLDERHRFEVLEERIDGVDIRRFPNRSHALAARFPFVFFRPRGLRAAIAALNGSIDVVHLFESRGPHVRWTAQLLPPQGIPFVWSAYGGLAGGVGIRRLYRGAYDRVYDTRGAVQAAAGLIAQTPHERDVYRGFGAKDDRIRLIPLGVNWDEFAQLPELGGFRSRIGVGDRAKIILFVGRIHPTKGLELLLQAFALARRQVAEAHLVAVGWDHGHLTTVRGLSRSLGVANAVTFCAPIFGADRLAAYVDADVFAITPPVFEETSLAALEAAASGTQCVLTRQCEILGLEASGAGRVVEYDREAIAAALIESLQPGVRERRGRQARAMVATRFTSSAVAREHERFYEEVLARQTQETGRRRA